MRLKKVWIFTALSAAVLGAGCAYAPGFPIQEGDVERGKQAFIDHQCHQCHSVAGESLPELAGTAPVRFALGGEIFAVMSYTDLMTSVINPNHVISERYREQVLLEGGIPFESPMPMPHVENMTVRQLIDLVAFLDSRYSLIEDYDSGM